MNMDISDFNPFQSKTKLTNSPERSTFQNNEINFDDIEDPFKPRKNLLNDIEQSIPNDLTIDDIDISLSGDETIITDENDKENEDGEERTKNKIQIDLRELNEKKESEEHQEVFEDCTDEVENVQECVETKEEKTNLENEKQIECSQEHNNETSLEKTLLNKLEKLKKENDFKETLIEENTGNGHEDLPKIFGEYTNIIEKMINERLILQRNQKHNIVSVKKSVISVSDKLSQMENYLREALEKKNKQRNILQTYRDTETNLLKDRTSILNCIRDGKNSMKLIQNEAKREIEKNQIMAENQFEEGRNTISKLEFVIEKRKVNLNSLKDKISNTEAKIQRSCEFLEKLVGDG
ncbi:hypothetical protein SNEBB_008386 [Seison nebaliae]|nr:hypothetical protein SNEBB_008386 [Seison nebaliae]